MRQHNRVQFAKLNPIKKILLFRILTDKSGFNQLAMVAKKAFFSVTHLPSEDLLFLLLASSPALQRIL